jgi:hypothetical protein
MRRTAVKYTAVGVILVGVAVACFAGLWYASGWSPDQVITLSMTNLILLLAYAACFVIGGVVLWLFGGKGYTETKGSLARRPTG